MRIKIYYKEYGTSTWYDWSQYLADDPELPQSVESEEEGEAGVITFEPINVTFYNETGNPVHDAFETYWTSSKKYIFKIELGDETGAYYKKFEGLADFSTLEFPDLSRKVSFDIADKLASLEVVESGIGRQQNVNLFERAGVQANLDDGTWTAADGYLDKGEWSSSKKTFYIYFRYMIPSSGSTFNYQPPLDTVLPGEIISHDDLYFLVKQTAHITVDPGQNEYDVLEVTVEAAEEPEDNQLIFHESYNIYEKNYYGVDINVVSGGALQYFDGFTLVAALVQNTWPEITLVNQTGDPIFEIPLQLYNGLISANPFDEHPADTIKLFADSLQSYVFIDENDQLIISERTGLGAIGTIRTIGETVIFDGTKRPFWDKLADGVEVVVKSGIKKDGEYLSGFAEVRKNANIKPRNKIEKEVFLTDETVVDQTGLDSFAQSIANQYLNFYGYRHITYDLVLKLDSNTIHWKLLDRIEMNTIIYFFSSINYNSDNTISLSLVSIDTYDYDPKSVVIPRKEDDTRSTTYATTGGSVYTTGNPYLWDGGATGLDAQLARDSIGIVTTQPLTYDIASGLLGLAFNINKFFINENGELDLTAGLYSFNSPLSEVNGVVDLLYNSDNLTLDGGTHLNAIQDIHQLASPQFAEMGLGKPATAGLSLDTNSSVNVGQDLTVQGNLTVLGSQFIADVQTVQIEDNLLLINKNETGAGVTNGVAGIEVERGTLTNYQFLFNETTDTFRVGEIGSLQAVATREDTPNIGAFSYWNSTAYRFDTLSGFYYNSSQLINNYDIGTSNYVSQLTGWEITSTGNADFRYIYADELHVKAFIADISQALAGADFLTKSVAILSRDFSVPSNGNSAYIYVEDLPGFPDTQVFAANDWVRLRVIDRSGGGLIVSDAWGIVTNYVDLSNGEQRWTFTTQDEGIVAGLEVYTGSLILDYGISGDGWIERTVLDPAGSPYERIVTWTTNPTNPANYSLKVQMGDLGGINHPTFGSLSGFGFFATGNAYFEGVIKALTGGEIAAYSIYDTKLETTNAILQGGTAPYFKIWKDSSTDFATMFYSNASSWGIYGKQNNVAIYSLGSSNFIGPWNFTSTQFYNGDVRLEASASLKGLAVTNNGIDVIKIGDFTKSYDSVIVDKTSNFDDIVFEDNSKSNWTFSISSVYWSTELNTSYSGSSWISSGLSSYYIKLQELSNSFTGVNQEYAISGTPLNAIKGKYITVSFAVVQRFESASTLYRNIQFKAYGANSGVLTYQEIPKTDFSNNIAEKRSYSFYVDASETALYLVLHFDHLGGSGTYRACVFSGFEIDAVDFIQTQINKDGIDVYAGPDNRFEISVAGAFLKMPNIEVGKTLTISNEWTVTKEEYGSSIPIGAMVFKKNGVAKGYIHPSTGSYTTIAS